MGTLAAVAWTHLRRADAMEAAIEIDRRYGLRERVSSTYALRPEERETEIGQALVRDAQNRVERIEVREHFPLSASWRNFPSMIP